MTVIFSILLYGFTMSETIVAGMSVMVEHTTNMQYFLVLLYITVEYESGKMASDMKLNTKPSCVMEFFHTEKIAPIVFHQYLLSIYRDQTEDVCTVKWWVKWDISGDSDACVTCHIWANEKWII